MGRCDPRRDIVSSGVGSVVGELRVDATFFAGPTNSLTGEATGTRLHASLTKTLVVISFISTITLPRYDTYDTGA